MAAFEVRRSIRIAGTPDQVRGHLTDFRAWRAWSPWEDLDPDLRRTYSDPSGGVGASYAWSGNRRAGEGSLELTRIAPGEVDLVVRFTRPFRNKNRISFLLETPGEGATDVTWRMTGETRGVMGLFSKVVPMDRLVGRDFEKGLARLKAVVESGS